MLQRNANDNGFINSIMIKRKKKKKERKPYPYLCSRFLAVLSHVLDPYPSIYCKKPYTKPKA